MREEPCEVVSYRGFEIKIYQDVDPQNPIIEWDMLGMFACWHRNYDLSNTKDFKDVEDFEEFEKENELFKLPLYLHDHSGITISTNRNYPFNCPWDSGQVGWVFVTYEKIKKEYNVKNVTEKVIEKTIKCLEQEVKTFDDYLTGNVYGFVAEGVDTLGRVFSDSCWGFYGGTEDAITQAKDSIDYHFKLQGEQEELFQKELEVQVA